jgi:predicted N-acetyltransferase YhbS
MRPVITRLLTRDELPLLHQIDRREYIANIYRLTDGELVLEPHNFDVPGWPPGHEEETMPHVFEAFDRGGEAWAAFDGEVIAGAVVTDVKLVGANRDLIQMYWLHVSRDYRDKGLGVTFIEKALNLARRRGAAGIYISATPSEHTVNFYRNRGATLVAEPDAALFAAEPEDIHFERRL